MGHRLHRVALAALCVGWFGLGSASATDYPPGFEEQVYVTGLNRPTSMTFAPDGRLFIAEKGGRIRLVTADGTLLPTPFATISVHDSGDRGLLGIALDPNFTINGWVYVDFLSPSRPAGATRAESYIQRVMRITALGNTAVPGSEVVLLDNIPSDSESHGGGDLGFGADGMLYVSTGDGAYFTEVDPYALRPLDIDSLNGKILRIDPHDGSAPASNPYYAGPSAIRSKVWCVGFRNPFHFSVKPGTSTLFVNDVGWDAWEEIDVTSPGANYGWPCQEGPNAQPDYQDAFPGICGPNVPLSPLYAYSHVDGQGCITGSAFVTSTNYPVEYRGNYFFSDYVFHSIQRAVVGPSNDLLSIESFATSDDTFSPVDLAQGIDGDLYVLNLASSFTMPSGTVTRVSYIGPGNRAPIVQARATPPYGYAPLDVQFSSDGTYDPDGTALSYAWDFGDGSTSTDDNPAHTYGANGRYNVSLVVSDGQATRQKSVVVTVGSRPPHATILTPGQGLLFEPGETISFSGYARDPDEGALPLANLRWTILLHHEDHIHPYLDATGTSGSFVTDQHGDPGELLYFEIVFTATDSSGLSRSTTVDVFPAANLAMGRPATASSFVTSPSFTGRPEDGNDGLLRAPSGAVSGWHSASNAGEQAWWQVDLGDGFIVNRVGVIPRPDMDEAAARSNFRVLGSNDADFQTGVSVLYEQGGSAFPPYTAWSVPVVAPLPLRYVRAQKTVVGEPFDFAEFQVFGGIAHERDLAVDAAVVDLDPSTPEVEGGEGGLGQAVDVVVTIRNAGTTTIESATLKAILGVPGTISQQILTTFADFDPAPGVQGLDPGQSAVVRVAFPEGLLEGCGSYSLSVTNRPNQLACTGSATGDEAGFNDRVVALDVFSLDLARLTLTIPPESQVIEDPATEPLLVNLDYQGLGRAGDRRDLRLFFDVTTNGQIVRASVRALTVRNAPSDVTASRTLYFDISRIRPALLRGPQYALQMRVLDLSRLVECARASTAETFTIP